MGYKASCSTMEPCATRAELNNMATTGSSNNTNLNGGYGNTYNNEGAATFAHSLGGGSTFLYDAGNQYNDLDIDETDYTSSTPDNVLKLGPTVSTSQVQVTADSSGSLTLTILDHTLILPLPGDLIGNLIVEALNEIQEESTNHVKLDNQLYGPQYGVQSVQFADGTVWTADQLAEMAATGSSYNTTLYGSYNGTVFDSMGQAHAAHGRGNGDTFIYNTGYGSLEIDEPDSFSNNTLKFGAGITASQLSITGDNAGDLIIGVGASGEIGSQFGGIFGAGDTIKLDGQLKDLVHGVQTVQFADGTTWTAQQLEDQATIGSAFNTTLYGGYGGNIFDSKGIATLAAGRGGGDTFIYNQGYGHLEIDETDPAATPDNVLKFGPGITAAQVKITTDVLGNMTITDGTSGDVITIDGQLSTPLNLSLYSKWLNDFGETQSHLADAPQGIKGVQAIEFADGTVINIQQLAQNATYVVQPSDNEPIFNFVAGKNGSKLDFSQVGTSAVISQVDGGTQITAGSASVTLEGVSISSLSLHDNFIGLTSVSFAAGSVTASMAPGSNSNDGLVHISTVTATGSNNTLTGGNGTETLIIQDAGSGNTLQAGTGTSTLEILGSLQHNDTLIGGSGSTTIISDGNNNLLQAGSGQTTASYSIVSATLNLQEGTGNGFGGQPFDTLTGITSVSVTGDNSTVNVANSGLALDLTGSANTVNISQGSIIVESGSSATIAGSNNSIAAGANANVGVAGNANSVTANGTGVALDLGGAGNTAAIGSGTVTLEGASSATVTGSNDAILAKTGSTVVANGSGMSLDVAGTGVTGTLAGGAVKIETGASATVNGNSDAITETGGASVTATGSGVTVAISGTGNSATLTSGEVTLSANAGATVNGNGNTITVNDNDAVAVASGGADTLIVSGTGNTAALSSSTVQVASGAGVVITGSNDAITAGANASAGVIGSANTATATGSGVAFDLKRGRQHGQHQLRHGDAGKRLLGHGERQQ